MQKPALVIMAAGLGSRYGGLKQAEPVGPHGELIIDYSIHDAMKAGFGRVICIIKPENREIFEERIGRRHTAAKIEYAYQRMTDLPAGYTIPEGRQKPWGTAHAVMCCAGMLRALRLEELAKLPLALQVNADTLLRWGTRRQGPELLELTATPLLGSDCHDMTKRPPNLKGGREMVRRKLGEAFLAQMDENARRLTAPTLAQV